MRSKTISLVLKEGVPYGIKTAVLATCDLKVIIVPRKSLSAFYELPEACSVASYVLLSEPGQDGLQRMYIGEADGLGERMKSHATKKDFWVEMIAFTTAHYSKTEVKYLENKLHERISNQGLVKLENVTIPPCPTLPQERIDVLDDYIDAISDILFSLGYSFLDISKDVAEAAHEGEEMTCKGPDAQASGILSDAGMFVRKGSLARVEETATTPNHTTEIRKQLFEGGILKKINPKQYQFTSDFLFKSASAAANVVLARSADGLIEWKNKEGKTIKQIEEKSAKTHAGKT